MNSKIISTGSYLPEKIVANADLTQFDPTRLYLIEEKTGIKTRRHAAEFECTSDLAIAAARTCLARINFDPNRLDALILATASPDRMHPATATRIQTAIGACNAFAFDVNSACSGAIYALNIADALLKSRACHHVLVVAAEAHSKHLNPRDFSLFPIFGDGAGALLVARAGENQIEIIRSLLGSDGSGQDAIQVPAGGTMLPYSRVENIKDIYMKMNGKQVYDFTLKKGPEIIEQLIAQAGLNKSEIDYVVPHQANINIIKGLAEKLEIDLSKFVINVDSYGNTAAASVVIAFDELMNSGKIQANNRIILVAFGGGFSWGATLIRS